MPNGTPLWLMLLAMMGVLFVLVSRRMSELIARTRELEQFQRAATRLDQQFAASADPIVAYLDEIRRHSGDPKVLADVLPGASGLLRAAAVDARALRSPRLLVHLAEGIVREMDRAVRAVELVEHGLDVILVVRGSRELEAQTSLKRGALNLLHARQVVRQLVAEIESVRPADLAHPVPGRSFPALPAAPTYLVEVDDADDEGPFEPRM